MGIIEYVKLRRKGIWGAWRLTEWDDSDRRVILAAAFLFGWYAADYLLNERERQIQRINDLERSIEMHREVIAEREVAIVTLLSGGMVKADNDIMTCRLRDAAGVRKWH